MFNLGAVISQQGLACDRTTAEGLITASKFFQVCALCVCLVCEGVRLQARM